MFNNVAASMVKIENNYPIHPNDLSAMNPYGKTLPPFPVTYRLSQELNSAMLQSMPKGVTHDDDDDDCDDDDDGQVSSTFYHFYAPSLTNGAAK
jgi:hypothetical protein